jgi:hypothetical protein
VVDHLPEISLGSAAAHTDFGSSYGDSLGWTYAPRHRRFYRWRAGLGVEERSF